jgi:basic membrane protein A
MGDLTGLKEGGVGLSPMKYTKNIVPADVLNKVETLKKMIAEGKFEVPDSRDKLNTFVPPQVP